MKKYSVCIHLLDYLLRYAAAEGLDREKICTRAGIDPSLFLDPDARISSESFMNIWQEVYIALGDELFGLNLGKALHHFPFGHIAVMVMLNSKDLWSALQNLIRYHNLMSDVGQPSLVMDKQGMCCFSIRREASLPGESQHVLFIFSMIVTLLRYLGNEMNLHPISVELTGSLLGQGIASFFNTEIHPNRPENLMRFRGEDLSRKIMFSNPDMLKLLEQMANFRLSQFDLSDTWAGKVRHILITTMDSERLSIGTVANALNLEIRTLQNYLKIESTGFRTISIEARKQKAIQLLADPSIAIMEIVFVLGFSEQSAFNHAFRKWTGVTPTEYRANRKESSKVISGKKPFGFSCLHNGS